MTDSQSQRWTTSDEIKWIDDWTPSGMAPQDKIERLNKYLKALDIRNIWQDEYGTKLDKSKLQRHVRRRLKTVNK